MPSVTVVENIIIQFDELTNGEKANKMTSDSNREEVLKSHISCDCTCPDCTCPEDSKMQPENAHNTGSAIRADKVGIDLQFNP